MSLLKNYEDLNKEYFLRKSSFSGLLSLYACLLSFQTKKGFTFESLDSKIPILNAFYVQGFLVACNAFQLIELVTNRNGNFEIITIANIDLILVERLEAVITELAKNHDSITSNAELERYSWVNFIKTVQESFINK